MARPALFTVTTQVRSFDVFDVVFGVRTPTRFVVAFEDVSVSVTSSTRVFSPIVSRVAVPPGTLAAQEMRVVCVDRPRSEQVSGIVRPDASA
jgi:hypothetical protein